MLIARIGEFMIKRHITEKIVKRTCIGILAVLTLMTGCGKNQESSENSELAAGQEGAVLEPSQTQELPALNILNDKYRTTYEIFVYSFYDSDGDGIGDLNGVTKMLDYINDGDDTTDTDLGCNEIWLMPISPSTTYHKYDVTDYKDIDPEYGTLEDFDNLVSECHKRGINIIIDTVFNHSSSQHPWFLEATDYLKDHPGLEFATAADSNASATADSDSTSQALAKALSECPYLSYYNFSNEKQQGYEPVAGTDYFYEARFWSEMPDLNLDSDALRKELSDITHFWTGRGVDGFRLDATTYYYTGQDQKNIEFLKWLKDDNKDAYFVGEAWVNAATYQKYYESGIDSFFDFEFAGSEGVIASTVRGTSPTSRFAEALEKSEKAISGTYDTAIDAPFYTNHDMARSAGYYTGSGGDDKLKLAYGLSLIMGGNSFIYYGEELGMKGSGKDENKRAPMQWTSEGSGSADDSIMCDGPKDMEKFEMPYPPLDEQATDPYSIYNYYKKAIRLRNTFPVIARGKTQPVGVLSDETSGVGAFLRYGNTGLSSDSNDYIVFDENGENVGMDGVVKPALGAKDPLYGEAALLIVINNGKESKTVDLSKWSGTGNSPELAYELNVGEETSALDGTTLTIPSYGIAVLK